LLISWLAYSSTLRMEVTCSSETSVDFQRNTHIYIPENRTTIWTNVAQDRIRYRALLNMETILRLQQKVGNFLTSEETTSFSWRTALSILNTNNNKKGKKV
jgi:hypothetical protein